MSNFQLIIDADPLIYRAGFAGEQHSYELIVQSTKGGPPSQLHFVDGNAMKSWKKWTKENAPHFEVIGQTMLVEHEPKEHVLQIIKGNVLDTIKAVSRSESVLAEDMDITLLLSGGNNYRYDIATVKPYKGNRKESHKPHWYQALRNYLTDHWDAKVIEGREADDECSILARQCIADGTPYCIATIDKDLDQIPGPHYDYLKLVSYTVSDEDADFFFWEQVLSGDSSDNIPGATKIGAKTAQRLLFTWAGLSTEGIWKQILIVYEESKRQDTCLYSGLRAEDVALEMARLVYMQREAGELWTPPGEEPQWLPA